MGVLGVGNILVNLYERMRTDKEIQAWLRLFTSLVVSGVISSCGMAGLSLIAGKSPGVSIGVGLFSLATAWFGVCSISPMGRYLIQALPKGFVEQIQEHPDTVTISGKDAEKQ